MSRDTKDYAFWREALKGVKQSVQEINPQCGFYKVRMGKDKPWLPVAFWRQDGEIVCGFQSKMVDPVEYWTWAAKNPVEETTYRFAVTNGRWLDEPEPFEHGQNMPTASDPFEALKLEIDDKLEQAESFLSSAQKEPSELNANMARNIQAALLQLNKKADALHKSEKQPHLDASRAIDAKFDFRKTVQDVAERLRKVFEAFMRAEEARLRAEAQKKFEEDRRKAEEARKAVEDERRKLEAEDPIMAAVTEPEPLPTLPRAPEPVKINVGGGVGRKAGLKTVYIPEIKDYRAALLHFADHAEVRAVIEKLVKSDLRFHKTKTTVPGVEVIEDRVAA